MSTPNYSKKDVRCIVTIVSLINAMIDFLKENGVNIRDEYVFGPMMVDYITALKALYGLKHVTDSDILGTNIGLAFGLNGMEAIIEGRRFQEEIENNLLQNDDDDYDDDDKYID